MRLGLGTYTYAWAIGGRKHALDENLLPLPRLLDKAAAFGSVGMVQICDQPGFETLPDAELDAIARQAAGLGLGLQIGTRGIAPERLLRFLAIANRLNANLVRTIMPQEGPGSTYKEAGVIFGEVLPEFEKSGVMIGLENHDRNLSADLRRLVEDVASPMFGICLDTVNSYGCGEDSRRVLDTLAPVTNCFHAKDYVIARCDHDLGFVITGAPAGGGMLDLPDIVRRLGENGRDPDIVIELWTPRQDDIHATIALEDEWATKSVAYLTTIVNGESVSFPTPDNR